MKTCIWGGGDVLDKDRRPGTSKSWRGIISIRMLPTPKRSPILSLCATRTPPTTRAIFQVCISGFVSRFSLLQGDLVDFLLKQPGLDKGCAAGLCGDICKVPHQTKNS